MIALCDLPERFRSKVQVAPGGCWNWTAAKDRAGYGRYSLAGRLVQAHRFSYGFLVGDIPDGREADHLCRNPSCVNPRHIEPVTRRENTLRSNAPSARHARKTHCPKGHAYSGANLYASPTKRKRGCRTCHAESERQRRARRKAASLNVGLSHG